ncbi:MAG TPA: hypothetical protein VL793_08225 [Patescibacteria group bacterium]|nr:hypothetical protein [Patescibacteria group bacterium]
MIHFPFWGFVILLGCVLVKVLSRPERIYEYPYFMAGAFGVFILPQAVSLVRYPGAAPEEAVERVFWMSFLCLAACLAGYRRLRSMQTVHKACSPMNEDHLLQCGLVFVACGIVFSFVLSRTEVQTSEFGGWTGPATIYEFFQQLCYPGFAICLVIMLRKPSTLSVTATLIAVIVPIQSIICGRRESAALFLLTIGLTFYFQWRLRPPRWVIASILAAAVLAIPATGTYRRFQLEHDWEAVSEMNLVANFQEFVEDESVLELRNAAMLIEATRRSSEYEYGVGYWNHLMFRYIPAQLLGEKFKESLMIRRSREGLERELAAMGYANPPGSTVTGMGDSFQQFGFWGCLFFAALGLLFWKLWRAASVRDGLFAQLLYIQSCTSAMRAVTHWTLDFLPGFVYAGAFLGLAAWYSRYPRVGPGKGGALKVWRSARRSRSLSKGQTGNHRRGRLQRTTAGFHAS